MIACSPRKVQKTKSVFVFVINLITLVTHEQVRATSIRGSVFVQLSSLLIAKIKLDRIRVSCARECEGFVVSIARIASIRLSTVILSDCLCLCALCRLICGQHEHIQAATSTHLQK